jgi:uncharacterized protein (TIGR02001 family)
VPRAPIESLRLAAPALVWLLCACAAARADVPTPWAGVSVGGEAAVTSDYIYRGVSESDGHGALQADLHLSGSEGTFLGLWASSRDRSLEPGAPAVLDVYLGQRFELGSAWSATLAARSHFYPGASDYEPSADYQELSAAFSYLDRWTVSVTAIPNAVRYWVYTRLSRAPAYVADASGQWLLGRHFFLTAGVGYYYSSATGLGIERATGYGYGNVGAAYEWRSWRLDAGYFAAQEAAARSFPYPIASSRIAATLSWHF